MRVIGFNLTKISAEKLSDAFKGLKIENHIKIEDILGAKADIFKKDEEAIQVKFSYTLDYSPGIAKITFLGSVILLVDQKESKEILKEWKDKKPLEELKLPLFNLILRKTNIKALELEDELNLPLHLNLPSLKQPKNKEK